MIETNFKRYEIKYILTVEQYKTLLEKMKNYMELDEYGRHKIKNIYFDTDDFRIIRHSLQSPKYKEKLRVRCYGEPNKDNPTFIELKKKVNEVVYKRRVFDNSENVFSYLCHDLDTMEETQVLKEIDYFKEMYEEIKPKVFLSYEREAYFSTQDENFRLTFDFEIKTRDTDLSLYNSDEDKELLSNEFVLLEVKTVMGLPFWFLKFLKENKIFKSSFSKYGVAYKKYYAPTFINNFKGALNA